MIQNWVRLYHYIHEYQHLVYDFYSKQGVAFLVTYWNLDKENTIWDNKDVMGGAYERTGELTGLKFNKYLLLPVYFPDEINTMFDGSETGLNKEQESSFVIPSSYGITPYPGDFIKLEQQYLQSSNDTYPIFVVTGIEIHPNTEKRFWKVKIKVYQSVSIDKVNEQTSGQFVFFDYDKQIYPIDQAEYLANLLSKSEVLKDRLQGSWDALTGFHLG